MARLRRTWLWVRYGMVPYWRIYLSMLARGKNPRREILLAMLQLFLAIVFDDRRGDSCDHPYGREELTREVADIAAEVWPQFVAGVRSTPTHRLFGMWAAWRLQVWDELDGRTEGNPYTAGWPARLNP
jgi:hypothetical protein